MLAVVMEAIRRTRSMDIDPEEISLISMDVEALYLILHLEDILHRV